MNVGKRPFPHLSNRKDIVTETTKLAAEPIQTEIVQANCIFCGEPNEIVEKLFPGQTHWQVDQNCSNCGERLCNPTWRKYEPEQAGFAGLEQLELTFRIICEADEAEKLALLASETQQALSKAIAETLALTRRFNVAPVRIVWTQEEEAKSEPEEDRWYY